MSQADPPQIDLSSIIPTSTPTLPEILIRPSLSRRSSRPADLQVSTARSNTDVVVEQLQSPLGELDPAAITNESEPRLQQRSSLMNPNSPCFIHSHLNKGASLNDWLKQPQSQQPQQANLLNGKIAKPTPLELNKDLYQGEDEDDDYSASLTAQLAETAVGVREMSKQLGRARIHSVIQNVLIVTKARDNRLIQLTRELALYLMLIPRHGDRRLVVYVDSQLRTSRRFDAQGIERDHPHLFVDVPQRRSSSSSNLTTMFPSKPSSLNGNSSKDQGQLRYWTAEMCSQSPHLFDFVVTLGGDGTVLFTSWLFQRIVPPVLPFALGSLGFLTNFDFADHQSVVDSAIESGIRVNLRMRFTCTVYRAVSSEESYCRRAVKKSNTGAIIMRNLEQNGWEALEGGGSHVQPSEKDKEIMCFTTRPVESFEILNDLVVDRGPSPYVSLLELFGDDHHLTTVQADGLTISTPTGSTAYSLSAGGSLVHPEIPSILITPICPHTLSFRPMLLPDSMELRICVPFNSRSTAWASFDGRGRVELKQGDHIKVTASKYPFPTVCADKQSTDWFHAISRTLKWNERERQKSFVMVEENPGREKSTKRKPRRKRSRSATPGGKVRTASRQREEPAEDEDGEEVLDDEEEDKFDIDDLSSETDSKTSGSSPEQAVADRAGTKGPMQARAEAAAVALSRGNPFMNYGAFSKSGTESGVDSPDRFMGPHPQPPKLSPRHVSFASATATSHSSSSEELPKNGERGARDDIHSPRSVLSSARVRIPQNRESFVDEDSVSTPKPPEVGSVRLGRLTHHRGRSMENRRDGSVGGSSLHRAFAVWGQDESDSNASDSDT